jgi:hypothetical protein
MASKRRRQQDSAAEGESEPKKTIRWISWPGFQEFPESLAEPEYSATSGTIGQS